MITQILQFLFPDNLDQIRAAHRPPDLEAVEVPRTPSRTSSRLPDADNRVRVHVREENEAGAVVDVWSPETPEGRRIALTDADMAELADRGLGAQDKVEIAAYIKGMVYAGVSRRDIVRNHPTDQFPGFSDGNIGKIMAALNAVKNKASTPTEGRG